MSKKRKFGTEENKIVLTPKSSIRHHSRRCLMLNLAGSNSTPAAYVDFYKVSSKKKSYIDEEQTFGFNLISNPYLRSLELRIGIWLFMHIRPLDDAALLDLTGKRAKNRQGIGEQGGIFTRGSSKAIVEYLETDEAIPIMLELSKDQICKSKDELLKALFHLHHFQYITVTEVSYRTSVHGRREFEEQQKGNKPENKLEFPLLDAKAEYVLVELNNRLTTHDYSGKWAPLSEPEKSLVELVLPKKSK